MAEDLLDPELASPVRNRYFYGKLLDQYHLEMEQHYFNEKRGWFNRLGHGFGVLCGLDVAVTRDKKHIVVGPGFGIDGFGREIVVPMQSPAVDPRQLTNDDGTAQGGPIAGESIVTVCLAYHECETEPVPTLVCDCDTEHGCQHGAIRERYRVLVHKGMPNPPPVIDPKRCVNIFGQRTRDAIKADSLHGIVAGETIRDSKIFDQLVGNAAGARVSRREIICRLLELDCAPPDEPCIPIAIVELLRDGSVGRIDPCVFRRVVYSNEMLFELILCLADRVDECCTPRAQTKQIEIVSGDAQTADVGKAVAAPLVARVSTGGTAVANETVTFTVTTGGGSFANNQAAVNVQTDANGNASAAGWKLGPNAGDNQVRASIQQGNPASVIYHATGKAIAVTPPRILRAWPTNGERLTISPPPADPKELAGLQAWIQGPFIQLAFDRKMQQTDLDAPDNWMRVAMVTRASTNAAVITTVQRVAINHTGPAQNPVLGGPGVTEQFRLHIDAVADRLFLVLIRATGTTIRDAAGSILLDADFDGGVFTPKTPTFDDMWNGLAQPGAIMTGPQMNPLFTTIVNATTPIPAGGTGNGTPGGDYDAGFAIGKI